MAYEGHIAGVGDRIPGRPVRSAAIRAMQSASSAKSASACRGSSPTSARCWPSAARRSSSSTEGHRQPRADGRGRRGRRAHGQLEGSPRCSTTTALDLEPAAFFCLAVTRRPVGGVATLLGGGYIASGVPGGDRLPEPYLPGGLRFDRQEAAGEVNPLHGAAAHMLRVGDRVYLRHAKAGELCERFNSLYLIEGERVVDEPRPTGRGQSFL